MKFTLSIVLLALSAAAKANDREDQAFEAFNRASERRATFAAAPIRLNHRKVQLAETPSDINDAMLYTLGRNYIDGLINIARPFFPMSPPTPNPEPVPLRNTFPYPHPIDPTSDPAEGRSYTIQLPNVQSNIPANDRGGPSSAIGAGLGYYYHGLSGISQGFDRAPGQRYDGAPGQRHDGAAGQDYNHGQGYNYGGVVSVGQGYNYASGRATNQEYPNNDENFGYNYQVDFPQANDCQYGYVTFTK